jgi:uncharacterized protein
VAEGRTASLDVLRGVAILGTFASNAWIFATPGGPAAFLLGAGSAGALEAGLRFLSNGKFLALLTLLFGVGIELQYRSAARRGATWPGRYAVRAAVLFVEGLLHYVLVFEFDVLMGYAIASLVVAHLVGRSDRAVRWWMAVVGATYAAGLLAGTALLLAAPDGGGTGATGGATGSWPGQVLDRIRNVALFRIEVPLIVMSSVVLFLAGSRLHRAGAFAGTPAGAGLRRRLMVIGFGVGVPLNLLAAFAGPGWFLVDRYLLPPLVALGLLALVTSMVHRFRGGIVRRGIAAVGQTALSCYVLQNLVAGALCYDWGLGLAARLAGARPGWVVGLWAAVSLLVVLSASGWLRRFDRGPLELVAHRLYRPPVGPGSITSQPP